MKILMLFVLLFVSFGMAYWAWITPYNQHGTISFGSVLLGFGSAFAFGTWLYHTGEYLDKK